MDNELKENNKTLDDTATELNEAEKEAGQFDAAIEKSSQKIGRAHV